MRSCGSPRLDRIRRPRIVCDQYLRNSATLHFHDSKFASVDGHSVADSRDPSELLRHVATHRAGVALFEAQTEPVVDLGDLQQAVDDLTFRRLLDLRCLAIEFVLDLADELLEQVLEGDDPRG